MTRNELLADLEAFSAENDRVQAERPKRVLNRSRSRTAMFGRFLAVADGL